ncbi:MAG: DNA recombination protein RmuC [Nitriliruptoraceae bacterium]
MSTVGEWVLTGAVVVLAGTVLALLWSRRTDQRNHGGADTWADLARVESRLRDVVDLLQNTEQRRASQFGEVREQLRLVTSTHAQLQQTTTELQRVLTNSQARGQWGERMAEDVLRAAGMLRDVNYRTQVTTRSGGRPDVTLLLPNDRVVHMDVKFPLAQYLQMERAEDPRALDQHRRAFLRAVRDRVGELDDRGYIDPAAGTLDCVLLFIPNDQIYGFVYEHDPELFDDALARGVVICAPTTLIAVLAVIRQVAEQAALERTSDEILEVLAEFTNQWQRFVDAMERVGRNLETTQRAYDALVSTRRSQLERQFERIDQLRRSSVGDEVHADRDD